MDHVGSAHTDAEYEALLIKARRLMVAHHPELDLGLDIPEAGTVAVTGSRMGVLWDLLDTAYERLEFDSVLGRGDTDVFRRLVLARIIEPVSKLESIRVLEEAGITAPSYATIKRRLPAYAMREVREGLAACNAAHVALGPATLVLYDVSTLYFETDEGDGFRESGLGLSRSLCK